MNRQISLSQYRNIDLTIMMVVQAVSQVLIYFAATVLYADQLYVVSPVAAVVALVMMRWSGWAAIHASLGGIIYALIAGGNWQHILIYGIGNLLAIAALLMLKLLGKEKVRGDALLTILFALLTQILMQLGRSAVAALLGHPAEICIGFITTDLLSGLFSMVIVWSIRRVEGLFEDQKHYLLRITREHKVERGEQF
jgi:hypothetical protein